MHAHITYHYCKHIYFTDLVYIKKKKKSILYFFYPSVSQNASHFTLLVAESNRLHRGALDNIPHRTGILAPNAMQDNEASPHMESSVE